MVQALHLLLCHFCFLIPKVGPKWTYRGQRVIKWLISILLKTAEASNSQIRSMVVPKSLFIVAGNDLIGYFQSATNSINATANYSVRNYFFLDYVVKCYRPQLAT